MPVARASPITLTMVRNRSLDDKIKRQKKASTVSAKLRKLSKFTVKRRQSDVLLSVIYIYIMCTKYSFKKQLFPATIVIYNINNVCAVL